MSRRYSRLCNIPLTQRLAVSPAIRHAKGLDIVIMFQTTTLEPLACPYWGSYQVLHPGSVSTRLLQASVDTLPSQKVFFLLGSLYTQIFPKFSRYRSTLHIHRETEAVLLSQQIYCSLRSWEQSHRLTYSSSDAVASVYASPLRKESSIGRAVARQLVESALHRVGPKLLA